MADHMSLSICKMVDFIMPIFPIHLYRFPATILLIHHTLLLMPIGTNSTGIALRVMQTRLVHSLVTNNDYNFYSMSRVSK